MITVYSKKCIVKPHKNLYKSEIMFVIVGKVDFFFYSQNGKVLKKISLTNFYKDDIFYYKIPKNLFHNIFIKQYFLFLRRLPKDLLKKMKQFMLIDISNNKRY